MILLFGERGNMGHESKSSFEILEFKFAVKLVVLRLPHGNVLVP
jgi:hypothetical protein